MDMLFQPILVPSSQQTDEAKSLGSIIIVERVLICCLRGFHSLVLAINNCSSLWAYFCIPLQVRSFREMRTSINTRIKLCRLLDVFDQKRESFINCYCHNVLHLVQKILSERPKNFVISPPLRLRDVYCLSNLIAVTPNGDAFRCYRVHQAKLLARSLAPPWV